MALLPYTAATAQQPAPLELSFGVYTSDKPSDMFRKFSPVLDAIEAQVAETLDRPVEIQLRIFKTYDEAQDALVARTVDFVRFGPASYVLVKGRDPGINLLGMEKVDGKKRFHGMIVVRRDSPIRSLEDLRGRSFAFGDPTSTIGRFLVQSELAAAGIAAKDLSKHAYLGRHDTVFRAVELGDYDAGAVKDNTFEKLNPKGALRILHSFENVTKPWLARAGLEPDVRRALRRALVACKDEKALKALKISGFSLARDSDYEFVRVGMHGARRFEGLPPDDPAPKPDGGK